MPGRGVHERNWNCSPREQYREKRSDSEKQRKKKKGGKERLQWKEREKKEEETNKTNLHWQANGWKGFLSSQEEAGGFTGAERGRIRQNFACDHYPFAGFRAHSEFHWQFSAGFLASGHYRQINRFISRVAKRALVQDNPHTPTSKAVGCVSSRSASRTISLGPTEFQYKDLPDGNTRFFLLPFILLGTSFPPSALPRPPRQQRPCRSTSGQHLDGPCFKLTFSRTNIAVSITNHVRAVSLRFAAFSRNFFTFPLTP